MKAIFDNVGHEMSKLTTKRYSTSFSLGIRFLAKDLQKPIYAIYGFVRFADEIVDSFHDFNKEELFTDFTRQTYDALEQGISLNPILNSFQWVVNEYKIPKELITAFLQSMEMDLNNKAYHQRDYEDYIFGSAEVVGLMCLKVFVRGNEVEYERLKTPAMKLGSAFQKINFLRDIHSDFHVLGRMYFPGVDFNEFNMSVKQEIETDIICDFKTGYEGIKQLPKDARFGVYMAYIYYHKLFRKIQQTEAKIILNKRIRITDNKKYRLFLTSYLRHNFNLI
ncbi:MAG: phytoene synthase [Candidatus Fluviicola riflensis]|nr:MAG: phytoene synthase [Candidatus Fluviicola riflensis]OGS77514.1 MAG: phytoene synthase [Candidatus Fluviicola riflensis]OGS84094.1 MAG: phytoene synthase [Fluviicola sp. RIFCSPHIGHO2_12_FULL_43_24]OGS84580.1 MAG: phytoene synthase [Fluviicola sp. RIFCSPHIGHO2_01_FULL_43_53]